MNWKLIERIGYGAAFNNLYQCDNLIKKESKNEYGYKKIQKEIAFYQFLQDFPMLPTPKFLGFEENSYILEFCPSPPLSKFFSSLTPEQKKIALHKIFSALSTFHSCSSKFLTKEEYSKILFLETITKIQERFVLVQPLLQQYSHIQYVNDCKLKTFDEILVLLQEKFTNYIESLTQFLYTPIHGDCQFNNILYDISSNGLTFIDPRGSFGPYTIYGPPEYDTAKIYFALSGYDTFDSMEVNHLEIHNEKLYLPNLLLLPHCLSKNDIITTYVISIWMGNAHCFIQSPKKAAFSYFYALYLGSMYL